MYSVVLTVISSRVMKPALSEDNKTCSMKMLGNDFSAYMACVTEFAHQSNWFPSPIAGLFSYQVCTINNSYSHQNKVLKNFVF